MWIPKRKTATFYEVRIAYTTKTHITQMSVLSLLGILGLGQGKKGRVDLTLKPEQYSIYQVILPPPAPAQDLCEMAYRVFSLI